MKKEIKSFIETFIRQHAKGDLNFGYDLSTHCDIPEDIQNNLLRTLSIIDREKVRELLLDHAQQLIDKRMPIVEAEDRYETGLIKRIDRINGEISFHKAGGF